MKYRRNTDTAASDAHELTPSNLEIWFWAICIFLLSCPFYFNLTGTSPSIGNVKNLLTMRAAQEGSSAALYALRALPLAAGLFLAFASRRQIMAGLPRLAPILLFIAWAGASLLWTDSFTTTLNALVALGMLVVAGYLIAIRLPSQYFARAMLYSGLVMAAFSLIWIVALPQYGMHQQTDASQSVHAGAWRGVYAHKNHLGQLAAVYAAGFLMAGRSIVPNLLMRWGGFAVMLGLIAGTDSASAIAIVLVTPVVVWALVSLNPNQRLIAVLFTIATALVGYIALSEILGLLGRDLTFSGRTRIWATAFDSMIESPLWGYGYLSSTYGEFTHRIYLIMGVSDPHNAFIDIALGLGVVGLVLFFVAVGTALVAGQKMFHQGGHLRETAIVLSSLIVAWLSGGMTEVNSRPFASAFGMGLLSLYIIVKAPRSAAADDRLDARAHRSARKDNLRKKNDYAAQRAGSKGIFARASIRKRQDVTARPVNDEARP